MGHNYQHLISPETPEFGSPHGTSEMPSGNTALLVFPRHSVEVDVSKVGRGQTLQQQISYSVIIPGMETWNLRISALRCCCYTIISLLIIRSYDIFLMSC